MLMPRDMELPEFWLKSNEITMSPNQSLYYALGHLAYAVAMADGKIQAEEAEKLSLLVAKELQNEADFDLTSFMFDLLSEEKMEPATVYNWAIKEIHVNSEHMTPAMKKRFIRVLEDVAKAFPPITKRESELIERFKKDVHVLSSAEIKNGKGLYKEFCET